MAHKLLGHGGFPMVKSIQSNSQSVQRSLFVTSKSVLQDMRNYLAGQVLGITRDESILEEVLKCAFCRVSLERNGMAFVPLDDIDPKLIARRYHDIFYSIRKRFNTLFSADDDILLEPVHIAYVDRGLGAIIASGTTHDLIGDIYETFIGSNYRGQEGQFFTPKVAVNALVELTSPTANDLIIDPACGSGSFLLEAARYISAAGEFKPEKIHGIDKDASLVRLSQLHLSLQYDTLFPVICADSLAWRGGELEASSLNLLVGHFTLLLANPPFGSKIVALSGSDRNKYQLAHKWRFSKISGRYEMEQSLVSNPSPQVLFVERCISLLAPGGRLGIVIPESVLSNPNHRHVVQYMLDHTTPLAIIGMPEDLFKTSGRGGTHTKICLVVLQKSAAPSDHQVFMAEAKWCGHNSRAREIPQNDLPQIVSKFRTLKVEGAIAPDRFGFLVPYSSLRERILAPRFYNPVSTEMMQELRSTHEFFKVSDLVRDKLLSVSTGDEVGRQAYGTGDIPFVRTSDISSWEIKVDPKHVVSKEVYESYAFRQNVKEGDILMVRDGSYLIGTCAFVTRYDTKIVYQSHIYKIRVHKGAPFDNYLLLAILSSQPILAQIKALSFTQDIIDTLGDRINDLVLPVPKLEVRCREISEMVKQVIEDRVEARELARKARQAVVAT